MPSFKIYGSVAGFYDYGPPGCAVKQNITQSWRQHFVLEEDMLQVAMHAKAAFHVRHVFAKDHTASGHHSDSFCSVARYLTHMHDASLIIEVFVHQVTSQAGVSKQAAIL